MNNFPSAGSVSIEPLPTIWRIDDALIYRGRSGLQWNQLPASFPNGDPFPDDSTAHRTMQRWVELSVLERIWALLVEETGELGGVSFEWQSVDTALGKLAAAATKLDRIPPIAEKTA